MLLSRSERGLVMFAHALTRFTVLYSDAETLTPFLDSDSSLGLRADEKVIASFPVLDHYDLFKHGDGGLGGSFDHPFS